MLFSKRFIIFQIAFAVFVIGSLIYAQQRKLTANIPIYGNVADFNLTDQNGKSVTLATFKNKIWVTDFIFTTCSGICPVMSNNMAAMNRMFNGNASINMVSISVNPENDSPEVLKKYGEKLGANERWVFLTGNRDEIQRLATESFKVGDIKEIVFHSAFFVLVDRKGQIRGYYDGTDKERMARLQEDLKNLNKALYLPLLPTINASLNALAGIFLLMGYLAIRRKDKERHRKWMMSAFICSGVFLACYLYYHFTSHIITRYQGQGIWRSIYFFILGTHTPLAALIVPFILLAIKHALKGDFDKHTRITRWLYPTWAYVSVTGVLIYLMLYVFRPA